jgi:hypothetical protein
MYAELSQVREGTDHFQVQKSLIAVFRDKRPIEYLVITPNPRIDYISSKMAAILTSQIGIQIELDDIQVKGISKNYTEAQLRPSFWIVGGTPVYDEYDSVVSVDGGDECDYLPGTQWDERDYSYDIMLRKRRNIR